MIKLHLLTTFTYIIITCLSSNCTQPKSTQATVTSPEDTLVQIPNEWVEKLRNSSKPAHELINEFEALLYPEPKGKLIKRKSTDDLLLKPTFINVDHSPEEELLLWIGHAEFSEFAVIKQIKGRWYLLYSKIHSTWQNAPKLKIGDALSKQTPKVLKTW